MTEATVGGVEEEEPPTDLITESTGPGLDLKAGAYPPYGSNCLHYWLKLAYKLKYS